MQADYSGSDWTALLRLRSHPDRKWRVLPAGERDVERRLLPGTGRSK
jgi:hypothetical protein